MVEIFIGQRCVGNTNERCIVSLISHYRCLECHRVFDLMDETDAQEFYYGHDCEAQ